MKLGVSTGCFCCSDELLARPLVAGLRTPPRLLLACLYTPHGLLEHHHLNVAKLFNSGHRSVQPVRHGVEQFLHHDGLVQSGPELRIPHCHPVHLANVCGWFIAVLYPQASEFTVEKCESRRLHPVGADEANLEGVPYLL